MGREYQEVVGTGGKYKSSLDYYAPLIPNRWPSTRTNYQIPGLYDERIWSLGRDLVAI